MAQGTDLDLAPRTQTAPPASAPTPCEPSAPEIEGQWPLVGTLAFAIISALILWGGIFAALGALGVFG